MRCIMTLRENDCSDPSERFCKSDIRPRVTKNCHAPPLLQNQSLI